MTAKGLRRGISAGFWVCLCYVIFCQIFFITHATGGVARTLSRGVLVPAAIVNGKGVSYHQVAELAQYLKVSAGLEQRKIAFDKALEVSVHRAYVEQLADTHGVFVTDEELASYADDDDRKYITEPLLLTQKTAAAVEADDAYQAEALDTMESLRKKLAQGLPMSDVAQNFSQDVSALSRGDLGIMSMGTLAPWLQPAVTLEPGDISQVLSAPDAYWTVSLIEFFPSEIPEQAAVHFRGVAVKKKTFSAIVDDQMAANPAWVFVW